MFILVNYQGVSYQLDVECSDTLASLKQRIDDEDIVVYEVQRLIFEGVELEDDATTLQENGICEGSQVLLVLRLKGGGGRGPEFLAPDPTKAIRGRFSRGQRKEKWRQVCEGLNIDYTCPGCKQYVFVQRGKSTVLRNGELSEFDIGEELYQTCPKTGCGHPLSDSEFEGLTFWSCKMKYRGYSKSRKRRMEGDADYSDRSVPYRCRRGRVVNGTSADHRWAFLKLTIT